MAILSPDPLECGGIRVFESRLRRGEISAEAATDAYLRRISALEPYLGAYEYVAVDQALSVARALDRLLAEGVDLGPLMGVPVAVKDNIAVEGMPSTAGSKLDVGNLIGPEGTFIKALKRSGCIVVGKTKTVEFAMGGAGTNHVRGTPWNPWDAETHRVPGGSSSGSAVAVAAGLCAFAIGTDTGGSVRIPSAFCGIFGLKTSVGVWPTDGFLPLSPALDTFGLLTKSANDAAIVFSVLTGHRIPSAHPSRGLRLGKPTNHFFDELDTEVENCMKTTLATLEEAGVEFVAVEIPEAGEIEAIFRLLNPVDLIAVLGRERFLAERDRMDSLVEMRVSPGLDVLADTYIQLLQHHERLSRIAREKMEGLGGWISPTTPMVAARVADFATPEDEHKFDVLTSRNTRPANYYRMCAITTPIRIDGSGMPVGLQVMCPANEDIKALSIGLMLEDLIGVPPRPNVQAFL